jgi:selenocysteine lyase/cysteine desulfurase
MRGELKALREREFGPVTRRGIYLNSASIGPMPASAIEVLAEANRDRADPVLWTLDRLNGILSDARSLAARLIGAEPDEIALMTNTTTGINVAARALPLGPGDVVLTFDREFPTNVYPWLARAGEGIELERIPCTPGGMPDESRLHERLAHPTVRAVCVSLTQFSTGYTVDLGALSRATRAAGKWLVVDAIQAVGQLPVDVVKTPVDFLACGAQKWLLSPWGTGFLYVRRELIREFPPTFAGWASFRGTDDYSRLTSYDPEPWPDARRFEIITLPAQDFAAMNVALRLLLGIGVEEVQRHIRDISSPLGAWAKSGAGTISSPTGRHGSGITCIRPMGDVAEAYRRVSAAGISCSLREGSIRLAPHLFNTREEIERVVEVVGG